MASSTIFFDGFGPFGGEHVGQIDPLFWTAAGNVSLSEYRTDRNPTTINGTANGVDFMGYTFGAVAKLNSHNPDGDQATLKVKSFAQDFTSLTKSVGLGYYINKIATDSIANTGAIGTNYAAKILSLQNKLVADSSEVDVLSIEAVHLSPTGYSGVSSPKIGLKVTQAVSGSPEVRGTFTFDVFGAPWYVENKNSLSTTMQRTIDAYDYKYGGLYVEVCVSPVSNTDPTYDSAKPYALQIKVNGMNLTVSETLDTQKLNIKNNFGTDVNQKLFFDTVKFYGARIPTTGNNSADPLGGSPSHLYHTYIDNVYIVEGDTAEECLLGPTTKVFSIVPKDDGGANRVNSGDWQGFSLAYNDNTNSNLESKLKDSNGDSTYVYTETSGAILAMPMAQSNGSAIPSNANYAIGGIKITNNVRKSNKDTSFINVWGTGTIASNMTPIGTGFPVTNNHYEYKNQYLLTNPVTASGWTFDNINNGKFGIKKTS
jgi:hypothetical protein